MGLPDLRTARRLLGFQPAAASPPADRRRGLRLEGSIGELLAGLRALGLSPVPEPIENGVPAPGALGVITTAGSRWTDCLEAVDGGRLSADFATALSRTTGRRSFYYDYDFSVGRFTHVLVSGGGEECLELMDSATAARERLEPLLRSWKMRDWGISLDDLGALRLPFEATVVVEAAFLRLDAPHRSRFLRPPDPEPVR